MTDHKQEKARRFMGEIAVLAQKYQLSVFAVTNGASITRNAHGCEAVHEARKHHIKWEQSHGYTPFETWEK